MAAATGAMGLPRQAPHRIRRIRLLRGRSMRRGGCQAGAAGPKRARNSAAVSLRTSQSPTSASRSGSATGASRSARRAAVSASKRVAAIRHSSARCWSTPCVMPCARPSRTPCSRPSARPAHGLPGATAWAIRRRRSTTWSVMLSSSVRTSGTVSCRCCRRHHPFGDLTHPMGAMNPRHSSSARPASATSAAGTPARPAACPPASGSAPAAPPRAGGCGRANHPPPGAAGQAGSSAAPADTAPANAPPA